MKLKKKDWILLLLNYSPLNRIHIMMTLFFIEQKTKRKIKNYFVFKPYLYGPCSFEVYSILINLSNNYLIFDFTSNEGVKYYLSSKGRKEVEKIIKKVSPTYLKFIKDTVNEISKLSFWKLMKKINTEAPQFTKESIFTRIIK